MTPQGLQPSLVNKQLSSNSYKEDTITPTIQNEQKYQILTYCTLQKLRNIEDNIFQEAQQAWDVLNCTENIRVDGKTYEEINQRKELEEELERVRANAPIYQNWNTRKKNLFFNNLASEYTNKLQEKTIEPFEQKSVENISETLETVQSQMSWVKKSNKKISKKLKQNHTPLKKVTPINDCQISCESICRSSKKVCFLEESAFKYFSKNQPSESIEGQLQYSCLTFDNK